MSLSLYVQTINKLSFLSVLDKDGFLNFHFAFLVFLMIKEAAENRLGIWMHLNLCFGFKAVPNQKVTFEFSENFCDF